MALDQFLISLGLIAEAVVTILAVVYIGWVYARRAAESRFFRMLVQMDVLVGSAGVVIAAVIVGAFLAVTLPQPWGRIVVGGAIAVLLAGPIYHAWTIFRIRRARGDHAPPPLRPGD